MSINVTHLLLFLVIDRISFFFHLECTLAGNLVLRNFSLLSYPKDSKIMSCDHLSLGVLSLHFRLTSFTPVLQKSRLEYSLFRNVSGITNLPCPPWK